MEDLKYTLKKQIIKELNLQEITPEDIDDHAPLFVEGLGLDSIDSLELIVIMEKYHGVRVPNEKAGREALKSIDAMAAYIEAAKAGKK